MIFSVRQLLEKCNEQNVALHIAFIDLTKAFYLISREGLFAILLKIEFPSSLFKIMKPFHTNTQGRLSNMKVAFLIHLKSNQLPIKHNFLIFCHILSFMVVLQQVQTQATLHCKTKEETVVSQSLFKNFLYKHQHWKIESASV